MYPEPEDYVKKRFAIAVPVALLFMAAAAAGEPTKPADTGAPPPASSGNASSTSQNQDEMICTRAHLTGTLLPGPRICKSRKIWEQQQRNAKDTVDDQTRRALQFRPPGG